MVSTQVSRLRLCPAWLLNYDFSLIGHCLKVWSARQTFARLRQLEKETTVFQANIRVQSVAAVETQSSRRRKRCVAEPQEAGFNAVVPSAIRSAQASAATKMHNSSRGVLMDWTKHGVKSVHSNELDLNTPQTSGMTRPAAITHASAGASKLWAGTMVVQPEAKTGPHHHGELETVLYVVKGRVRMRWGDELEFIEEAKPGDFIYLPPFVPHQEINASQDETCEAVVVRDGQDPIVVNLDLRTPEPASAGHRGMPFHPDR